jgi:hypothetical protein
VTQFVLLPSPLLGPAVWRPVSAVLTADGHDVATVDLPGDLASPDDVLVAFVAGFATLPRNDNPVLVAHSNAGLYLPAVAGSRDVRALIFVDAALPPITGGRAPTATARFRSFLATRARDGALPPWSEWWDEDLASLYPDASTRRQVESEQQRLPLSYFEGSVPVPEGWTERPCGYLAFGDTYAAERATAQRCGWPVRVLDGDHLEMLIHPEVVAAEIRALATMAEETKGIG